MTCRLREFRPRNAFRFVSAEDWSTNQAGKLMAKIGFLEIKNHPKRMQLKNEGLTAWVAL